jgi:hypothetical protein
MKDFLNSKYFQEFQRQQQKLTEGCVFQPNLSMTKSFNQAQEDREASRDPEAIFKRTIEWKDRSNQRIEQLRKAKAD